MGGSTEGHTLFYRCKDASENLRDQGKEGVKNNEKVRHWTLPCVLSCSTFRLKWYDDNGAAGSRGADVVVVHSTTHGTLQQQMSRK